jgi:hypothetical protein
MLFLATLQTHPVLLAAGRGGGRAAIWIAGWLILLGLIVAGVRYVSRRRSRSDDKR